MKHTLSVYAYLFYAWLLPDHLSFGSTHFLSMLTYFTHVSSQSGETLGSVNESIAGKEKTPQLSTDIQKDNLTLPGETSDANSTRHFFTYTQVLCLHCKTATFSVAFCVLNHPCLLMLEAIRASRSGRSRNIAWEARRLLEIQDSWLTLL